VQPRCGSGRTRADELEIEGRAGEIQVSILGSQVERVAVAAGLEIDGRRSLTLVDFKCEWQLAVGGGRGTGAGRRAIFESFEHQLARRWPAMRPSHRLGVLARATPRSEPHDRNPSLKWRSAVECHGSPGAQTERRGVTRPVRNLLGGRASPADS